MHPIAVAHGISVGTGLTAGLGTGAAIGLAMWGAGVIWWVHDDHPRKTVFCLLVGPALSGLALLRLAHLSVALQGFGLLAAAIGIFLGLLALHSEVIRGKGHSPMRTPATALAVGIAIAIAGSPIIANIGSPGTVPSVISVTHTGG